VQKRLARELAEEKDAGRRKAGEEGRKIRKEERKQGWKMMEDDGRTEIRRDVFLELTWQAGKKGMLTVADRCVDVSMTCMVRPEIYICNTMQSCCQIL